MPGLTHKLHKLYGSKLLPVEYAAFTEYCHRFPAYLRNFFWVDPDAQICVLTEKTDEFFPTSQWFVSSSKDLSFAAKAGHNDEPHNHNDIGSFFLVCDDGQILCDFGAGEYTRDYFQDATRYNYLCNASFGHNVPIINGTGQLPGKQYCGKVLSHDGGIFKLDMAGAYETPGLRSAVRQMQLDKEGFTLQDNFDGDALQVTERFVTMVPPKNIGGIIHLGKYRMETAPNILPKLSLEIILNHEGHPDTLYLIDYAIGDSCQFVLKVTHDA